MLFIAFLITIFFTFRGWYASRDIFSPFVIQPGVWAGLLLLYYIVRPDFYPIIHDFPIALVLWCVGFLSASYAVFVWVPAKRGLVSEQPLLASVQPSRRLIHFYVLVALVLVPFMLIALVRYGLERGEVNLFLYIRMASTMEDYDKPEFGLLNYLIPLILVSLILVFTYVRRKWALTIVVLVNIASGFITMSKTAFFVALISAIYILYSQKRIRVRTIGIWMVIFLLFSVWFQYVRMLESEQEKFSVANMISLYTMSPCVAFDYYAEPASAAHPGEHVFRFYYAIMHALGSDIEPAKNIQTFVGVPELTNTYTVLHPFYIDFGLWGVFIFGLLYGAFYGFLYKRAREGNNVYFVIYAFFISYLALQFVQEDIFSLLSLNLQSVVFLILPFIIGKIGGFKDEEGKAEETLPVHKNVNAYGKD